MHGVQRGWSLSVSTHDLYMMHYVIDAWHVRNQDRAKPEWIGCFTARQQHAVLEKCIDKINTTASKSCGGITILSVSHGKHKTQLHP